MSNLMSHLMSVFIQRDANRWKTAIRYETQLGKVGYMLHHFSRCQSRASFASLKVKLGVNDSNIDKLNIIDNSIMSLVNQEGLRIAMKILLDEIWDVKESSKNQLAAVHKNHDEEIKLKNEEISSLKSEIEDLKNSKELLKELKSQLKIAKETLHALSNNECTIQVLEAKNKEVEELKKSKNEEISQLKQQLLLYKRMLFL